MQMQIDHLSFAYCTRQVLEDITFSADRGELVAVLGPNGVGKSTLFRCILGLHTKYRGDILLDGREIRTFSPKELAHQVAYIPQSHGQTFSYSVEEMVLMGTAHVLGSLSRPGKKERSIAWEAMEKLGIGHLATRNFCHLSGGEQQLVLIARALAQQTNILLMDEPTASLDFGNQEMVLSRVRELTREGYTVLLSTHNPQQALWCADTALALQNGTVAAWGKPQEVVTPELLRTLYGVRTQLVQTDSGILIAPLEKGAGGHVSVDR